MTSASLSGTAISDAVIRFLRTHPADFKEAGTWLDETFSVEALTAKDRAFYETQEKRCTPDHANPTGPPVPLLQPRSVRAWKRGERISKETGSLIKIPPPGPYSEKHCSVPKRLGDAVWDLLEGMRTYVAPVLPPLEFSRRVVLVYWLIVDSETDTFLPTLTEMQDWSFGLEMNDRPSEADVSKHSLMHISPEAVVADWPAWEADVGRAWACVSAHAEDLGTTATDEDGTQSSDAEPFMPTPADRNILQSLAEASATMSQVEIEAASGEPTRTVKDRLPKLEQADLVRRPHGERMGYAISSKGRKVLSLPGAH